VGREQRSGSCAILLRRFIDDQSGVTAIEYGLIAALIAVSSSPP